MTVSRSTSRRFSDEEKELFSTEYDHSGSRRAVILSILTKEIQHLGLMSEYDLSTRKEVVNV